MNDYCFNIDFNILKLLRHITNSANIHIYILILLFFHVGIWLRTTYLKHQFCTCALQFRNRLVSLCGTCVTGTILFYKLCLRTFIITSRQVTLEYLRNLSQHLMPQSETSKLHGMQNHFSRICFKVMSTD